MSNVRFLPAGVRQQVAPGDRKRCTPDLRPCKSPKSCEKSFVDTRRVDGYWCQLDEVSDAEHQEAMRRIKQLEAAI